MIHNDLNKPTIEFISDQSEPVAALVVTKSDAEAQLGCDLSSDEWADLCHQIKKYGLDYPFETVMANLTELID